MWGWGVGVWGVEGGCGGFRVGVGGLGCGGVGGGGRGLVYVGEGSKELELINTNWDVAESIHFRTSLKLSPAPPPPPPHLHLTRGF